MPRPAAILLAALLASLAATAMEIDRDGGVAVILTYRGVNIYGRSASESWFDALQKPPQSLAFGSNGIAEAIAFSYDKMSLFVTVEGRSPPVYRSDRLP